MQYGLWLSLSFITACGNQVSIEGSGGSHVAPSSAVSGSANGSSATSVGASASQGSGVTTGGGGACASGLADCDMNPANGCEVDTQTDPTSCGACGHDCQGGACQAGACQPVVLATGQTSSAFIAADANRIYWTNFLYGNQGTVLSVPKVGGSITVLASGQALPRAIALDASYVYWANAGSESSTVNDGAIMRVPLTGGTVETVAGGQADPALITLTADKVYWANYYGQTIASASKSGGAVTTVTTTQKKPVGVGVDGSHVYWTESGSLMNLPLLGGPASLVASSSGELMYLTLDANDAYWLSTSELGKAPLDGLSPPSIVSSGLVNAVVVVVDGSDAYLSIAAPNASIVKVALGGGSPVVLVTNVSNPAGLAVDPTTIYWADPGSGQIMKLAK